MKFGLPSWVSAPHYGNMLMLILPRLICSMYESSTIKDQRGSLCSWSCEAMSKVKLKGIANRQRTTPRQVQHWIYRVWQCDTVKNMLNMSNDPNDPCLDSLNVHQIAKQHSKVEEQDFHRQPQPWCYKKSLVSTFTRLSVFSGPDLVLFPGTGHWQQVEVMLEAQKSKTSFWTWKQQDSARSTFKEREKTHKNSVSSQTPFLKECWDCMSSQSFSQLTSWLPSLCPFYPLSETSL